MSKYENLLILINSIVIFIVIFLPKEVLFYGEMFILFMFFVTYLIGDNKSTGFLDKYKYMILLNIALFVSFRDYPRAYTDESGFSMELSKFVIIAELFILGFIMMRAGRLRKNEKAIINE